MALVLRPQSLAALPIQPEVVTRDQLRLVLTHAQSEDEKAMIMAFIAERGEANAAQEGYLEDVFASAQKSSAPAVKQAALATIRETGKMGENYHREVVPMLDSPDVDVVYQACLTLGGLGPVARSTAPAIAAMLRHHDETIRCAAAAGLGGLNAEAFADEVAELLSDPSPEVQGSACIALGELGDAGRARAPEIAKRLGDPRLRVHAIAALGHMAGAAVEHLDALAECLLDEDIDTRMVAGRALGNFGSTVRESTVQRVAALLKHQDGRFRLVATFVFACWADYRSGPADVILGLLRDCFEEPAVDAGAAGGGRVRQRPIGRKVRCGACLCIGRMVQVGHLKGNDAASAAQAVGKLLFDDDWETRYTACDGLGLMGCTGAGQSLEVAELLNDQVSTVRAAAAACLGELGDAAKVPDLVESLKDGSPHVRQRVLESLQRFGASGDEHLEKIVDCLADIRPNVRKVAIETLAQIGDRAECYACVVAQKALEAEAEPVKTAALRCLGKLGKRGAAYAEDVVELLTDPLPQVRAAAAECLGDMHEDAKPFVKQLRSLAANDPDASVRTQAAVACACLGDLDRSPSDGE